MTYIVCSGDTLGRIAKRFGTTLTVLLEANPQIRDADRIQVGDVVQLPASGARRAVVGGGPRPTRGREQSGPTGLAEWSTALTDIGVTEKIDLNRGWSQELIEEDANETEPPWLVVAKKELGVAEIEGKDINESVRAYMQTTTIYNEATFQDDEVPWCSGFINWCMKQAAQPSTNSALAISWKKLWKQGRDLGKPAYGAIGVIWWHPSKTACRTAKCSSEKKWDSPPDWQKKLGLQGCTKGHVGFVVGTQGNKIVLLGGNQSDQVKLSAFGKSNFIGYMVPRDYVVRSEDYQLREYTPAEVDAGSLARSR